MPGLVIKDFPESLHHRLKDKARKHHRSLTREALTILEEGLMRPDRVRELPRPVAGKSPINDVWLDRARDQGRA